MIKEEVMNSELWEEKLPREVLHLNVVDFMRIFKYKGDDLLTTFLNRTSPPYYRPNYLIPVSYIYAFNYAEKEQDWALFILDVTGLYVEINRGYFPADEVDGGDV